MNRCKCFTKKGRQCKNTTDGDFCHMHSICNRLSKMDSLTIPINIMDSEYYIATSVRVDSLIDTIYPFGNFDQIDSPIDREKFSSNVPKNLNPNRIADSRYGCYFRFVKKTDIPSNIHPQSIETIRSFVFRIKPFIDYIISEQRKYSTHILHYAPDNYYGIYNYFYNCRIIDNYKIFDKILKMLHTRIHNTIQLYTHELVCKIPIPLSSKAGYLGQVDNSTIL